MVLLGAPCKHKPFSLTPAWICIQEAGVCRTRGRHLGKARAEEDRDPLQDWIAKSQAEANVGHHWSMVPQVDINSIHSSALWRLKEGQMKHEAENWDTAQKGSGLTEDDFKHAIQELVHLMPAMEQRLLRLQPAMLAAWARDPGAVAAKLLQLHSWMPRVDVSRLVVNSPSLLMEQNFQKVEAALVQLHAHLPESSVASLVQRQTLYLTEDLEYLLAEVKRLFGMPDDDAALRVIEHNPDVVMEVTSNRHLSLW